MPGGNATLILRCGSREHRHAAIKRQYFKLMRRCTCDGWLCDTAGQQNSRGVDTAAKNDGSSLENKRIASRPFQSTSVQSSGIPLCFVRASRLFPKRSTVDHRSKVKLWGYITLSSIVATISVLPATLALCTATTGIIGYSHTFSRMQRIAGFAVAVAASPPFAPHTTGVLGKVSSIAVRLYLV